MRVPCNGQVQRAVPEGQEGEGGEAYSARATLILAFHRVIAGFHLSQGFVLISLVLDGVLLARLFLLTTPRDYSSQSGPRSNGIRGISNRLMQFHTRFGE